MTPAQSAGPTAALAGVPTGLQAQGLWVGRRQLFVRFAAEAETATMYTAAAIAQELKRGSARSAFHSISVGGRDPLANLEFLEAAFKANEAPLPVMLDIDGQRPDGIKPIAKYLKLVQVTLEGTAMGEPNIERALGSLKSAEGEKLEHALVLAPGEQTSDGQLLRIVEQAHAASAKTVVVIHPPYNTPVDRDRRWVTLIERSAALHADVRLTLRLPPPTGTR
jgi:organic radical activating enzyme